MTAHVELDEAHCAGHGICVAAAPRAFAIDEETGMGVTITSQVDGDDLRAAELAAAQCPERAITVKSS